MPGRGSIISSAKAIRQQQSPTSANQGLGGGYIGSVSPMARQLDTGGSQDATWTNAYRSYLPRPADDFTNGAFGPFSPILPVPVDAPDNGGDFPDPRLFQYEVGWNLPTGQPGSEGLKLADFNTLRTLADLYSVARACIQLRKNEIRGIDWDIMPTHDASKAMRGSKSQMKDFGERRAEAMKFFLRGPDPDYFSWDTFIDAFLEEVFVFDALSLLFRSKWDKNSRKGLLGSNLDSISLINGPTIRPLLDMHGAKPRPPAAAYQQYLYGVPRSDYMTLLSQYDIDNGGLKGSEVNSWHANQLLYLPMVPRRWTPYGFPPIERALIPVMSGLQKQGWQLDYYREGTVPGVYISPGGVNANMTPNQIRELQDALNAIAGDPAWKHKIIVLPADSKVMPQRVTELADAFDEVVMNQVCMAFDVQPMELGILPKVSTTTSPGAAHQMAKMTQDVQARKATKPTLTFIADIMDYILQVVCGQDDMRFVFEGTQEEKDEETLTNLLVQQIGAGLRSIDEGRAELKLQPWGLPETSDPGWNTPQGWFPLQEAVEAQRTQNITGPLLSLPSGAPQTAGLPETPPQVPGMPPAGAAPSPSAAKPAAGAPAATTPASGAKPAAKTAQSASQAAKKAAPATQSAQNAAAAAKPAAKPASGASAAKKTAPAAPSTAKKTAPAAKPANSSEKPASGAKKTAPAAKKAAPAAKKATSSSKKPSSGSTPAHDVATANVKRTRSRSNKSDDGFERAVDSEFEAMARHVKKGRLLSSWEAKHIGNEVLARIAEHMAKGLDVDTAIDVTRRMRRVMDNGQEFWADPEPDDPDFWSNPAGGGGFTKFPHDAEDIQVGKGENSVPSHPEASADVVYDQMTKNFPPEAIEWIKDAHWTGPVSVPSTLINLSSESKWAAAHESDKVHAFMERIREGDLPHPSVAVLEPGDPTVDLVDGHHRALAYMNLGLPVRMYIGRTHTSNGPWAETHSFQVHHGSDPQNKAESETGKVSKASVNYRQADNPHRSCGTCSMFRAPGACTLVEGIISPDALCNEWDPRSGDAAKGWGPQGPKAAGIAVQAADTGRVLMLQRSVGPTMCPCGTPLAWGMDSSDWWSHADGSISHDDGESVSDKVGTEPPDPAAGMWEFPGGCLENAESPAMGAVREWQEETGMQLPFGRLKGKWLSSNGVYRGLVYEIPSEDAIDLESGRDQVINPDDPDGDSFESLAWWDPAHLADNPAVRQELQDDLDAFLAALGTGSAPYAA